MKVHIKPLQILRRGGPALVAGLVLAPLAVVLDSSPAVYATSTATGTHLYPVALTDATSPTLRAKVVAADSSDAAIPTGTVSFTINGLGPVQCDGLATDTVQMSGGVATCKITSTLPASGSPATAQATYGGNDSFAPSDGVYTSSDGTFTTGAGSGPPTQTGGGQCATSGNLPAGGAYTDPADINDSNGFNTYVENDIFTSSEVTQNTCATGTDYTCPDGSSGCNNSPAQLNVDATVGPPDNGGVQSYPDVAQQMNDWGSTGANPPLAALTGLSSTFSTTVPPTSEGNWEESYDIWLSNGQEVMIWVDTSASRLADNGASICDPNVTIAGQSYTFQDYGDSTCNQAPSATTGGSAQFVLNTNETSGTMNILAVLDWLEANHPNLVPAGVQVGEIDFGWELCSTVGTQDFAVNGYTLTRTPLQP